MSQIQFKIRTNKKDVQTNIFVRVSNGRNNEAMVKTPFTINSKYWDKKHQKIVQRSGFEKEDYTSINVELSELNTHLVKELNITAKQGNSISRKWLEKCLSKLYDNHAKLTDVKILTLDEFIDEFVSKLEAGSILTKKGKRYAKETVSGYKQLKIKLLEYSKKAIHFKSIDRKFGIRFMEHLTKQDLSLNYIGKVISRLKRVMNVAKDEGLVTNREYLDFVVYKEPAENIYLTLEEIEKIYTLNIKDKIDKDFNPNANQLAEYEKVKDIFVFACFTGQRISDYKGIKKHNFKKTKNMYFLKLTQVKTDTPVSVPLRKEALMIAEKYDFLLPTIYEQKINKMIKILGKLVGIDEEVEVKITRGGKINKTVYKKYDLTELPL